MNLNKIKTVSIFLLIVLALYQTEMLWFKNYSNRNFFYTFFSKEQLVNSGFDMSVPDRIILNSGSNRYQIVYHSEKTSSLETAASDILTQTMLKGQLIKSDTLDWNSLLQNQSIIYEYSAEIPTPEFLKSLGISNSAFSDRVNSFQKIIITVDSRSSNQLTVSFVDEAHTAVHSYSIRNNTKLYSEFTSLQKNAPNTYYIYSGQGGNITFYNDLFIYQWTTDTMAFPKVLVSAEYEDFNKIASNYFDNIALAQSTIDSNGVQVISDQRVIVKYNPNGLFEYSNYKPAKSNQASGLASSYAVAKSFLAGDKALKNNIILKEIIQDENNWVFYFDYTIDDFPVVLGKEISESLKLTHAIEITANDEKVVKYRRYFVTLSSDSNIVKTDIGFSKALDKAVSMLPQKSGVEVQDVMLAYELNYLRTDLRWLIQINSETYRVETEVQ